LSGHAASHLSSRCFFRNAKPRGEALNPLLGAAGHDNETIKAGRRARFQEQRGFHDRDTGPIAAPDLFHPLVLAFDYSGVHDRIEFLNPCRASGFTECKRSQSRPIDASVGIENFSPKVPHHFVIDRLPRLHEFMSDIVRPDQTGAKFDEHLSDGRFAARNPAGKADS
jgi:hypothetical protein